MKTIQGEGAALLAGVLEAAQLEGRPARALASPELAVIEVGSAPYLCGSFSSLSVAELLGMAGSTLKTCRIDFVVGAAKKTLWMRDGQLVWAGSTEAEDRLGPALLREKMIDPGELGRLEKMVRPGRKLGRVLVEEGALRPPDVYLGIGHQVRHIALSLFDAADGSFALVEGVSDAPAEVKVPQRVRDLVLEGLRRPELSVVASRPEPPPEPPRPREPVLQDAVSPSAGRGPFEVYRRALHRAWEALEQHGGAGHLELYLLDPRSAPGDLFEGLTFERGGNLDVKLLLANATRKGPEAMGRARALEALERLLSFAMFEVKSVLPPAEAAKVLAEVQGLQLGKH